MQRQKLFEEKELRQESWLRNQQAEVYLYGYRDSAISLEQFIIYPKGSIKIGASDFEGDVKAIVWLR